MHRLFLAMLAAVVLAGSAGAATTYYNSDGYGYFTFVDGTYNVIGIAALPQFDPAIAKGSVLKSVFIEFTALATAAGGSTCDGLGNSEAIDNHVTVSILGSTFSKGGTFGLPCGAPFEAIDYFVDETLHEILEFDSSFGDLSQFIGTGTIPFVRDYGGHVISDRFDYLVEYSFVPSLSPVPLPASFGLLGAALTALGFMARRRKARA